MAIEIERKFLVTDDSYKALAYHSDRIAQGYICREGGNSARVRVRGDKGYITIKGPSRDGGLSRYEWEKEIPADEARDLLALCWFKYLTGRDITENTFDELDVPVTEEERKIVIAAVNNVLGE